MELETHWFKYNFFYLSRSWNGVSLQQLHSRPCMLIRFASPVSNFKHHPCMLAHAYDFFFPSEENQRCLPFPGLSFL